MARRKTSTTGRGLYMISVAAELSGLHPQTLRIYERKRLISPQRSSGNTRLYSDKDIERLQLITRLTDEGINLTGVVRILQMRDEMEAMRRRIAELEEALGVAERRISAEADRVHRSYKAEIVHVRRGGIVPKDRG
jgi:MerR family transcriptional regulator/heat shock protein HspR